MRGSNNNGVCSEREGHIVGSHCHGDWCRIERTDPPRIAVVCTSQRATMIVKKIVLGRFEFILVAVIALLAVEKANRGP